MLEQTDLSPFLPLVKFKFACALLSSSSGHSDLGSVSDLSCFEFYMVSLCYTSPKYTHWKSLKSFSSRALRLRPVSVLECYHTSKLPKANLL